MKLNLDKIRTDGGTQPRSELLTEVIEDYAEQMRQGAEFPPVVVFFDGKEYWLADGFHRFEATRRDCPNASIEAELIQGTQAEAQWYSFSVNKTHGLRRTREDRVRAIKAAIRHPEGAGKSNYEIAEHCGVNESTVRRYRRKLATTAMPQSSGQVTETKDNGLGAKAAEPSSPTSEQSSPAQTECRPRVGRDGRTINTAKIGKNRGKTESSDNRRREPRVSRNAHSLKRGHSDPCPLIPLQFSPRNPKTAAATICQHFPRSFIESLISELNERLSTEGVSE